MKLNSGESNKVLAAMVSVSSVYSHTSLHLWHPCIFSNEINRKRLCNHLQWNPANDVWFYIRRLLQAPKVVTLGRCGLLAAGILLACSRRWAAACVWVYGPHHDSWPSNHVLSPFLCTLERHCTQLLTGCSDHWSDWCAGINLFSMYLLYSCLRCGAANW